MCKSVVAIDVGGTKISGGVVNENGEVMFYAREPTDRGGGDRVVNQLAQMIDRLIEMIQDLNCVAGVGISIPGAVNNNVVLFVENIQNWENLALAEILESKLRIRIPVTLVDDRAAAALGECWLGAAKNKKNSVVVIIGTGVGAGIMIDGKPYFGSTGFAGSIGWWITDRQDLTKRTIKGLLEENVAGPGIVEKAITELRKRRRKVKTLLLEMCERRPDRITSEMIFDAANRGDTFAHGIVENAAVSLGVAISNIVTILNPEMIVVAGGVGEQFVDYSETINEIVTKFSQPYSAKDVEIAFSKLGYHTHLLGVTKYVLEIGGQR